MALIQVTTMAGVWRIIEEAASGSSAARPSILRGVGAVLRGQVDGVRVCHYFAPYEAVHRNNLRTVLAAA